MTITAAVAVVVAAVLIVVITAVVVIAIVTLTASFVEDICGARPYRDAAACGAMARHYSKIPALTPPCWRNNR